MGASSVPKTSLCPALPRMHALHDYTRPACSAGCCLFRIYRSQGSDTTAHLPYLAGSSLLPEAGISTPQSCLSSLQRRACTPQIPVLGPGPAPRPVATNLRLHLLRPSLTTSPRSALLLDPFSFKNTLRRRGPRLGLHMYLSDPLLTTSCGSAVLSDQGTHAATKHRKTKPAAASPKRVSVQACD